MCSMSPTLGAAIGSPAAIPSTTEIGNCSLIDDSAMMSNRPTYLCGSGRKPGMTSWSAIPMLAAVRSIFARSGPSPTITSRILAGQPADRADQSGQVLDLAQPGQRADHDLAGLAREAGDRLGIGRARIQRGLDAVGDAMQLGRRQLPHRLGEMLRASPTAPPAHSPRRTRCGDRRCAAPSAARPRRR